MFIASKKTYFIVFVGCVILFLYCLYVFVDDLFIPLPYDGIATFCKNGVFILDFFLILLICIDYSFSIQSKEITIIRNIEPKLSINRDNPVTLIIQNFSTKILQGEVLDTIPGNFLTSHPSFKVTILPMSKLSLNYSIKPFVRGTYHLDKVHIKCLSRFSFFYKILTLSVLNHVEVYPDLKNLQELSIKLTKTNYLGTFKKHPFGFGYEFASLKEYALGDDIKHIDWKATAKRDYPIIKTYEAQRDQNIIIMLDAGRMMTSLSSGMTKFDWGLNALLSLSLTALKKGDHVGIAIFADTNIIFLPPKRGKSHFQNILATVHNIQPRNIEPDYAEVIVNTANYCKKRSMFVIITDLFDTIASKTLLDGITSLLPRHLSLCITYTDKAVTNIASQDVSTLDDIYNKGIALDLLKERQNALNKIIRKGCLVLDVPPENLNDAIVEKYLSIKASGLI